jgi:hypothetical protein
MINIDIAKKSDTARELTTLFLKGRAYYYEKITPAAALPKDSSQSLQPTDEDCQNKETFTFEIY